MHRVAKLRQEVEKMQDFVVDLQSIAGYVIVRV
jgi:hypothetical protein